MKQKKNTYQKYTPLQVHDLLAEKLFSVEYKSKGVVSQPALFCPYYVSLKGELGLDWGAIVNPASLRFGQLVFEHDACGCTNHEDQSGNQLGTSWIMRKLQKVPASPTR